MSRPTYRIKNGDDNSYRVHLDDNFTEPYETPFVDPVKGVLRVRSYKGMWGDPELINIRDLYEVNSLAVGVLMERGYDLDGLQANFWLWHFWGFPNIQERLSALLGDEYRWEPELGSLIGTIRRAIPRGVPRD